MKLLKVLTIILFSLFLFFSVSYTQEKSTADTGVNNLQENSNTENVSAAEKEKAASIETKTETDKVISDPVNKKKTSASENKREDRKSGSKKKSEKAADTVSVNVKEENPDQLEMDGDLLLINEGNFKYKRIPDIKLVDVKPEAFDSATPAVEAPKSGQNTSTGFLGLSKTASDVIFKGGALLFLLLIFVLYKSRMSGPGSKSSKKRNVLNSYRK